jgi:hypothetical protein
MKDFVKVQMNSGGARAIIANVEKGMTMLACRPCSVVEVESLVSVAEAVELSAKNCTFQESLQIKMTDGTPGHLHWHIYVTFGEHCSYFTKVSDIYQILISDRVEDIKWVWTLLKCRQLTWVLPLRGEMRKCMWDLSSGHDFQTTLMC